MQVPPLEYLGNRVRLLRKERKLTQEKLADLCNISVRTVADIEHGNGNPTYLHIISLLCVFSVSADQLFPPVQEEGDVRTKELLLNYKACAENEQELFFECIKYVAQKSSAKE